MKINSVIKQDLSNYIERNFPESFISIYNVVCNNDASLCTAYLTDYQDNELKLIDFMRKMKNKKSDLQLTIARQHEFKKIPKIIFKTLKVADTNVDNLLNIIDNERR